MVTEDPKFEKDHQNAFDEAFEQKEGQSCGKEHKPKPGRSLLVCRFIGEMSIMMQRLTSERARAAAVVDRRASSPDNQVATSVLG